MRRHTLTTITAAATFVLALTGCGSDSNQDDDAKSTPSASSPASADGADTDTEEDGDHKDDVVITKHGVEDHEVWGPDAYVVHYKITNSGDDAADYFVQLEFLDKDGDVLGTTGVGADKLGAGKSKTDNTSPLPAEIENGEMADIDDARVVQIDRTDPI